MFLGHSSLDLAYHSIAKKHISMPMPVKRDVHTKIFQAPAFLFVAGINITATRIKNYDLKMKLLSPTVSFKELFTSESGEHDKHNRIKETKSK